MYNNKELLQANYRPYTLNFKFEARTSRGKLTQKRLYFIKLWNQQNPEVFGIGEVNILQGLSPEAIIANFDSLLSNTLTHIPEDFSHLAHLPALRFALETAHLDLIYQGKRKIFDTPFFEGKTSIPINGLIWMGDRDWMKSQIDQKIQEGYQCIKLKIGALDFLEELNLLAYIRREFGYEIELRVDANGAFTPKEALEKLKKLADYQLHSIEQPIAPNQWEAMAYLCEHSPVAIALDEELIGLYTLEKKKELLKNLSPAYLVLKPALLGGFSACQEWIALAEAHHIDWWVTSALESNIGLNAIAQWASSLSLKGYQGLGTGQLYHNNITSPLIISSGFLRYTSEINWSYPPSFI